MDNFSDALPTSCENAYDGHIFEAGGGGQLAVLKNAFSTDTNIHELLGALRAGSSYSLGSAESNNPRKSVEYSIAELQGTVPYGAEENRFSHVGWPIFQRIAEASLATQPSTEQPHMTIQNALLSGWTAQDGLTGGNQPMAGYYDLVTAGLQQLDVPMQNPCIDVTSQLDGAEVDRSLGFLPTLPLKPHPKLCKDSFTPEQDNLLMTLKQAGKKYSEIADAMRSQSGADISVNRLVKRFDKIRDLYLDALPEAVKNVMPEVMACIKEEMEKMDLEALPHMDKQLLDEIVTELPRSIPKFVQSRVLRKRKTMMSAKVGQLLPTDF